jgi:hypothetical protein
MRRPSTSGFETKVGGAMRAESSGELPPIGDIACVSCGNPLEREARFCSECGTTVTPTAAPTVVTPPILQPVAEPRLDELRFLTPDEPRQPTVVIPPALGGPAPTVSTGSERLRDDRASGETAPLDFMKTPVSIELPTETVEEEDDEEAPSVDTAFLGSEKAPVSWSALGVPVWIPAAAAGLAAVALMAAALVHFLGASPLPGFTPAELDLKVQMRAIEWLLAGILLAVVGLLLKR